MVAVGSFSCSQQSNTRLQPMTDIRSPHSYIHFYKIHFNNTFPLQFVSQVGPFQVFQLIFTSYTTIVYIFTSYTTIVIYLRHTQQ